jgi:hypothetical protein
MCLNAVKTSFLTANSILSTNLYICDGRWFMEHFSECYILLNCDENKYEIFDFYWSVRCCIQIYSYEIIVLRWNLDFIEHWTQTTYE